jgi:DNA-binding transcriptional regulator GbsR (MarR family)
MARAVRAENIRRWLSLGPLPFAELARDMQCSRFALSSTLKTMRDVRITYQSSRPRRAVVECVA